MIGTTVCTRPLTTLPHGTDNSSAVAACLPWPCTSAAAAQIPGVGADGTSVILTLIAAAALVLAVLRVLRHRQRGRAASRVTARSGAATFSALPVPAAGEGGRVSGDACGAGLFGASDGSGSPGRTTTTGWDVPFFASVSPVSPVSTGSLAPLVPAPRRPPAAAPRFPWVSVSACLIVALTCGAVVARHEVLERRLSSVSTELVGARASVHCQTFGETWTDAGGELGYVRYGADGVPEHHALIKYDPCRALASWVRSDRRDWSRDQLVAVHVLTHEAMHMRGETVEARAECQAMQRNAVTARLLGASVDDARRLAQDYWEQIYPRMSDGYRSPECGPGGPWDEHLPDAPWGSR